MNLTCPNCNANIDMAKVNINTDLAQCESCHQIHKLNELVDNAHMQQVSAPPEGSKLVFHRSGDEIEIALPANGWKFTNALTMIFPIFWIGFMTVWTSMALIANVAFALFSIPFWVVGGFLMLGLLNNVYETQKLFLTKSGISLERKKIQKTTVISFKFEEIYNISKQQPKMKPFDFSQFQRAFKNIGTLNQFIAMPAILTGQKSYHFFENASDAEQDWTIRFLNAWKRKYE